MFIMSVSEHAFYKDAHGDIEVLRPTGASRVTAVQQGYVGNEVGVAASRELARQDLLSLVHPSDCMIPICREYRIDSSIIAGIISRSSRVGKLFNNEGLLHPNIPRHGLMQIPFEYYRLSPRIHLTDFSRHFRSGVGMFRNFLDSIARQFPDWTPAQHVQGAVAAFNCGVNNVISWEHIDMNTHNCDFSNDVIARAQFYRERGYY